MPTFSGSSKAPSQNFLCEKTARQKKKNEPDCHSRRRKLGHGAGDSSFARTGAARNCTLGARCRARKRNPRKTRKHGLSARTGSASENLCTFKDGGCIAGSCNRRRCDAVRTCATDL